MISITIAEPRLLAAVSVAQAGDDPRVALKGTRVEADGTMIATDGGILTVARPEEIRDASAFEEFAKHVVSVTVPGRLRTALKAKRCIAVRLEIDGEGKGMASTLGDYWRPLKHIPFDFLSREPGGPSYPKWENVMPEGMFQLGHVPSVSSGLLRRIGETGALLGNSEGPAVISAYHQPDKRWDSKQWVIPPIMVRYTEPPSGGGLVARTVERLLSLIMPATPGFEDVAFDCRSWLEMTRAAK